MAAFIDEILGKKKRMTRKGEKPPQSANPRLVERANLDKTYISANRNVDPLPSGNTFLKGVIPESSRIKRNRAGDYVRTDKGVRERKQKDAQGHPDHKIRRETTYGPHIESSNAKWMREDARKNRKNATALMAGITSKPKKKSIKEEAEGMRTVKKKKEEKPWGRNLARIALGGLEALSRNQAAQYEDAVMAYSNSLKAQARSDRALANLASIYSGIRL